MTCSHLDTMSTGYLSLSDPGHVALVVTLASCAITGVNFRADCPAKVNFCDFCSTNVRREDNKISNRIPGVTPQVAIPHEPVRCAAAPKPGVHIQISVLRGA